jgi:dihydrodipicolinate synthase/N-acetylneuraminate lyase
VPPEVLGRLRDATANLRGLKVSDSPLERVTPYLREGLDVFVGSEPLVLAAMELGAAGAVSGLAAAFPEVVAALVHERSGAAHRILSLLRDRLAVVPFHAAMKEILAARGVPVRPDVRAPLRGLTGDERAVVSAVLDDVARLGGGTGPQVAISL